jgi:hypothetical protein
LRFHNFGLDELLVATQTASYSTACQAKWQGQISVHSGLPGRALTPFLAVVCRSRRFQRKPRRIWSLDLTQADPFATKKETPISLKDIRIEHLAVNACTQTSFSPWATTA